MAKFPSHSRFTLQRLYTSRKLKNEFNHGRYWHLLGGPYFVFLGTYMEVISTPNNTDVPPI